MLPAEERLREMYELHEELGRGGMGVVYRATQRALDREVALKILAADLTEDETLTRRFIDEARLAAAVIDPCLVRVLDVDAVGGRIAYIAYELVRGKDLHTLLENQGTLPRDLSRGIALDLLSALSALHRQGILHRDVKPSNVLVGPDGRAKLTDLGIARDLEDSRRRTRAGTVMGTPGFVSPEQIRGEPLTPAIDVYAAGAVMYALTTGQVPFPGTVPMEIVNAQLAGDPPLPGSLKEDADPVLGALAMKALERDPRKRITLVELRNTLAPYDRRSMGLIVPADLLKSRGLRRSRPDGARAIPGVEGSSGSRRRGAQGVSRTGAVRQVRKALLGLGVTGIALMVIALAVLGMQRGREALREVRGPEAGALPSGAAVNTGPSRAPVRGEERR